MEAERPAAFGRQLESLTDRYLGDLVACVGTLAPLVARYRANGDHGPIVERTRRLESDCDEAKRELGGLVTSVDPETTGIRLTWIYLHTDRLLELYGTLDSVANTTEQFATELTAIEPPRREPCLDGLHRMAEHAAAAVEELEAAVSAFVRALCRPEGAVSLTEQVTRIRTLESEADTIRGEVLSAAFDDGPDGTGVVYRQLAVLLDAVLDAIEDVTDRMHLLSGTEEWLELDIYPAPEIG
jgi:uncharacterized protein Yka (UPF0111/DUF47 family)